MHFQNGQRLVGFNTENQELNEGLVRFDIVFYVRMKDGPSEYDIPLEENFRRDVSTMCNLSQGVKEEGIAIGEAGLIMTMYKNGFSAEQIASATDKTVEEIKTIIEGKEKPQDT